MIDIDFIKDKLLDMLMWIRYRTTDKHHIVKLGLNPGYHDTDEKILYAIFSIINDFVEIEKAHMQRISERTPFLKKPFRVRKRSRELGLKYLDWEISLPRENLLDENGNIQEFSCLHQAEVAEKIKEIYLWWNDVRPLRRCPMELSGISDWYFKKSKEGKCLFDCLIPSSFDLNGKPTLYEFKSLLTEEEEIHEKNLINLCQQIEEEQHEEDQKMLAKVIEIRRSLWT
jgi:hypothetical protein